MNGNNQRPPPSHKAVRQACKATGLSTTTLTVQDGVDFLAMASWAMQSAAGYIRHLEAIGQCDPRLYESVKGIQLDLERKLRRAAKHGVTPREAPPFEDMELVTAALAAICHHNDVISTTLLK